MIFLYDYTIIRFSYIFYNYKLDQQVWTK